MANRVDHTTRGGDVMAFTATIKGHHVGTIYPFTERKQDIVAVPVEGKTVQIVCPLQHTILPGWADTYGKLWREFREYLLEQGFNHIEVVYHCPPDHMKNRGNLIFWWNAMVFRQENVGMVEGSDIEHHAEIYLR